MKRHYIFASHGSFANGLLNSVELILGKQPDIQTLCAYVEEEVDLTLERSAGSGETAVSFYRAGEGGLREELLTVYTLTGEAREGLANIGSRFVLTQQVEALLARFPAQDELIVITDIFAGSVNNEFVRFLSRPHFHLLSGLNLPLIIDLLISAAEENTEKLITEALTSAKESIQYCNQTIASAMTMDKDF